MEKLIYFLKTEYSKDALEIQTSIELLSQCLDGSIESIKGAHNIAFDNRNYKKLSELQEMLQTIDKIQCKLEEYVDLLQLDDATEETIIKEEELEDILTNLPDYDELTVDSNIPYTLYDDYTYKKPAGFELFGVRQNARDWKEVFVKTCEVLARKDKDRFEKFADDKTMQGRTNSYFCTNSKDIRSPMKVPGADIYIMTNMSSNQIRNVIERMLRKYQINISEFKIFLRADYTARHR